MCFAFCLSVREVCVVRVNWWLYYRYLRGASTQRDRSSAMPIISYKQHLPLPLYPTVLCLCTTPNAGCKSASNHIISTVCSPDTFPKPVPSSLVIRVRSPLLDECVFTLHCPRGKPQIYNLCVFVPGYRALNHTF